MRTRIAKTLAWSGVALLFAGTLSAQRQHVIGLIGDMPPDGSNWPHPAAPDGNPFPRSTDPPALVAIRDMKIQLGKAVFWDEQLSADNTMSCGTCHIPTAAGTDNRKHFVDPLSGNFGAFGVLPQHANLSTGRVDYGFVNPPSPQIDRTGTGLHTPTMIGAYVFNQQFWDLRAGPDFVDMFGGPIPNFSDWAALEDQVAGPPISPIEMGHEDINWASGFIQKKLSNSLPLELCDPATIPPDIWWVYSAGATYGHLFDKVFSGDPQFGGIQGATRERIAMVVAHYMRTLIPDQAPIDLGTMTQQEVHGFKLMSASGCFACHSVSGNPVFLTPGGILANPFDNPLSNGTPRDIGFGPVKIPTLRNVGLKQRFFSTGRGFNGNNSLTDIIKFYDQQPGILGLTGSGPGGTLTAIEFASVQAFLGNALTDPRVKAETFPFDRPQLASERPDFNPFEGNEYGQPTPAPAGGHKPQILANSPPMVPRTLPFTPFTPTDWFKVGVGEARPATPAVLLVSNSAGPGPVIWIGAPIVAPVTTTNADGIGTIHNPFPLTVAVVGLPHYAQWFVNEPSGTAFSNAARFVPFQL